MSARRRSFEAKQKACSSKRRYSISGVAEREAERFGMDFYPCVRCGGWHLTTRPEVRELRRYANHDR
jgi:hypothetical protein